MGKPLEKIVFFLIFSIIRTHGFFKECKEKSDIVFLIDSSGSIAPTEFDKIKVFIKRILLPANIDSGNVRVGILRFDHRIKIQFQLNTYTSKREIFEHVDSIILSSGFTNTADALRVMNKEMFNKTNGDRPNVQNIAMVITDGMASHNMNETIPRAKQARLNGVHIIAIGIGDVFVEEIREIASLPSMENAFILEGFSQLRQFKDDFFRFCKECKEKSDIIFLIDTSGSIATSDFQRVKFFIKRILLPANIDSGNVKVGVLKYDNRVMVQFQLNTYTSKRELFEHVDSISLSRGFTNTAEALKVMNEYMFTKTNGDRQNVQNIAMVITDGKSNVNGTMQRAKQARLNGVHIIAIGIGEVFVEEIRGIASLPSMENAFILEGYAQLRQFRDDFFRFCKVVDPMTSCSSSETANMTTKVCTVYNVWEIQCLDIAWKNSDNRVVRMGDDSSKNMTCAVNDRMTLTTSMTYGEGNWTATYSPMKGSESEKKGSGTTFIRGKGGLVGLLWLLLVGWISS